jgi:acyl dehydratase
MMSEDFSHYAAGTSLPAFTLPTVDIATLEGYADASGDHALIHLDAAAARSAGFPGIIAHGLLVMAYLGRAVTAWYPEAQLRELGCRFMAVTLLGDRLTCGGSVVKVVETETERVVELDVHVVDERGESKLKGSAKIIAGARRTGQISDGTTPPSVHNSTQKRNPE